MLNSFMFQHSFCLFCIKIIFLLEYIKTHHEGDNCAIGLYPPATYLIDIFTWSFLTSWILIMLLSSYLTTITVCVQQRSKNFVLAGYGTIFQALELCVMYYCAVLYNQTNAPDLYKVLLLIKTAAPIFSNK